MTIIVIVGVMALMVLVFSRFTPGETEVQEAVCLEENMEPQVMCEVCRSMYARVGEKLCYLCENALNSLKWDIEHELENLTRE